MDSQRMSGHWYHRGVPGIPDTYALLVKPPAGADGQPWPTVVAEAIFTEHLLQWADLFLRKNASYGESDYHALGVKGYVPEFRRKLARLVRALWNEEDTRNWSEQPAEIVLDLIGTLFMMYDCMMQPTEAELQPLRAMLREAVTADYRPDAPNGSVDPDEPGDAGWSALPDSVKAVLQGIHEEVCKGTGFPSPAQVSVLSEYYLDHGQGKGVSRP